MRITQITLAVMTASIITGCGLLGPTYKEPTLNMPTNWSSKDTLTISESQNLAELAWWKKFNDPQLNALIESAFLNNNNLQVAMGNMLQAQAALRQVSMSWVPMIGLGGTEFAGQVFNPGFTNNSAVPLGSLPLNNTNFNGNGYGVLPTYTLNVFQLIKQNEIAKLNIALQQQSINAVRLGIITQVANSYFTLLGLQRQYELQQQILTDALEMHKYSEIQYRHGKSSDLNLLGLDQYIAGLKANLPMIKSDITQAQNALQVLTNNNPAKIKLNNNFANITTDNIVPVNLPSAVLKNRPDVISAEYQLQLNNADIGAVTSAFFPTISLTGGLGQGSVSISSLFDGGGDFWMGQLAATMPLLNLGLYAQVDKAKAGYYSAYYNYVQTVRNAFAQVDNGLVNHDSLTQNLREQQSAIDKAQAIYAMAQKQLKQGAIAYSDSIGFKLNVDYGLAKQNQIKIQQLNSLVNLYQALGGGYLVESNLTSVKKFNDSHDI